MTARERKWEEEEEEAIVASKAREGPQAGLMEGTTGRAHGGGQGETGRCTDAGWAAGPGRRIG